MRSLCVSLVVLTGFVSPSAADIPPPPPPKGEKYVLITHEVVLASNVKGYVFVEWISGFGGEQKFRKLELGAKAVTLNSSPDRRGAVALCAVQEEVARKFKSDADLFKAISDPNRAGELPILFFERNTTIKSTDKRDKVKWTHTIQSIGKNSIDAKIVGDGYKGKNLSFSLEEISFENDPNPEDAEASAANPMQPATSWKVWIVGVATALALITAGLWFGMRSRGRDD